MPQKIVIAEQVRIAALLTDERVEELIVAQGRYQIGDVYLGTIENVLPGIDAAFVNIGASEKNGFIHVSDLGPLRLKKNAAGITELLEPRQKVLVQVMKEPTGSKGPRLTGNLALPGRYLILQPHGQGVNISRRINGDTERNRLRALGVLIKPPGSGLLVRTEAEGVNEELLIDDLENLLKQWEAIQQAAENSTPPILLNRDEDFIHRILRDHISTEISTIIVETDNAIERAKSFLGKEGKNVVVECHKNEASLLDYYKINTTIISALKPRVDLPSGGYIIIEPTEALTVIDVNSGSFTRSANSRETVLWTNCEAAIEIARQLKLRNIGGVIIIDFIDMDSRRDQLQLLEYFTAAIKDDSSRPQIAQLTELGLVELTRKRQGQNIYELFSKSCNSCNGLGHLEELPSGNSLEKVATDVGLIQKEVNPNSDNGVSLIEHNIKGKNIKSNNQVDIPASDSSNESMNIDTGSDTLNYKQKPEVVGVHMSPEEELVYSYLGLNPVLLLKDIPKNDNILAQVIRPEEDADAILEEARMQISNHANKRKRKGKNNNSSRINWKNNDEVEEQITEDESQDSSQKEIDKKDFNGEEQNNEFSEIPIINSTEADLINESEIQIDSEDEKDDSRRRRRRSSASS